ncbi:Thiamine repressible regulatory protein thi1 [Metarhizium anisopliae]|nr:Thiamine repressible regulatory protein thi1 [Metarhizium anisopliae]
MSTSPSVPITTRRLPTRCDSFRPCSLCLRADVECESAQLEESARIQKPIVRKSRRRLTRRIRPHLGDARGSSNATTSPSTSPNNAPPNASEHDAFHDETHQVRCEVPSQLSDNVHSRHGEADSAMGIARKISRLGSQGIESCSTFAIPDGGYRAQSPRSGVGDTRIPISTILGSRFPDRRLIQQLMEDYFDAVHWFSLVIYEPKFRKRLASVEDGYAYQSDASFLTLLSMVLCMAAWYRSNRAAHEADEDWRRWSEDLLGIVESRLICLMDETSITAVQTCILLGSHHVYHGRPNLSFALLGATIKISHALGIHRHLPHRSPDEIEERKRVWWTIYTWDRFASISYGRPLSINDEDFNLEMPLEYPESPYFSQKSGSQQSSDLVYSRYQTELSSLYRIVSPALKVIFGSISTHNSKQRYESEYASLLTFDNVLIVLYRPFLAKQVDHLSIMPSNTYALASRAGSPVPELHGSPLTESLRNLTTPDAASNSNNNSEYWLSAAVRTGRLAELPELAQLAKESHLVAFMAINLFHAAIVLILLALSDPLSDRAQKLKRTITRVLRLQQLLGKQSALSKQSGFVLQNLISLLLKREEEAMLGRPTPGPRRVGNEEARQSRVPINRASPVSWARHQSSPLGGPNMITQHDSAAQVWPNLAVAQQLNESLTSVQQAHEQSFQAANLASAPFDERQVWNSAFDQSDRCEIDQAVGPGAPEIENGTNGLFWLWDFNWDSGHSHPY